MIRLATNQGSTDDRIIEVWLRLASEGRILSSTTIAEIVGITPDGVRKCLRKLKKRGELPDVPTELLPRHFGEVHRRTPPAKPKVAVKAKTTPIPKQDRSSTREHDFAGDVRRVLQAERRFFGKAGAR